MNERVTQASLCCIGVRAFYDCETFFAALNQAAHQQKQISLTVRSGIALPCREKTVRGPEGVARGALTLSVGE